MATQHREPRERDGTGKGENSGPRDAEGAGGKGTRDASEELDRAGAEAISVGAGPLSIGLNPGDGTEEAITRSGGPSGAGDKKAVKEEGPGDTSSKGRNAGGNPVQN